MQKNGSLRATFHKKFNFVMKGHPTEPLIFFDKNGLSFRTARSELFFNSCKNHFLVILICKDKGISLKCHCINLGLRKN